MIFLTNNLILETRRCRTTLRSQKSQHMCQKWGFKLSSIIEIIARKTLKKYGLNLSCWNIPTIVYQNLENDIFILIGRNTSLLNQWLNSHYLSPTHKQTKNDFFVEFLLYRKQHSYSGIDLRFNWPLFARIIFINRSEDFYHKADVT